MQHIVCFSGGHSSGLVALAVVRRFGPQQAILLNHDIHPHKEDADIKRFKRDIAAHLGVPITYANHGGLPAGQLPDQFQVSLAAGGFKQPGSGNAFCTHELKTKPFHAYLKQYHPPGQAVVYYGFDDDEQERIARRRHILGALGYDTCFPLAEWPDTLESTREVGIEPPLTYATYKHGNCAGCLKGGIQHWYVTFCHRPDVYAEAEAAEATLGYTINRSRAYKRVTPLPLAELRPIFARMQADGVPDTEHYAIGKFSWDLRRYQVDGADIRKPCECSF
ncbi:hypothetical protein ACFPAF_04000 [Hymenobacter endophyticus]|uniref:Phosphoadenosine phosphosulphate reductase domain-containing protein n=1 Tax=Hymenobacter endophyticus TaxID=3076335 RepID=A0ABU3TDT8_9BACT|nr:hypothetical protein [Hymenobacter endophyticus]MDU0369546.1 hypothetical protein [Hymenobacter endophyticus]